MKYYKKRLKLKENVKDAILAIAIILCIAITILMMCDYYINRYDQLNDNDYRNTSYKIFKKKIKKLNKKY